MNGRSIILTISTGSATSRRIWSGRKPLALGGPRRWVLERASEARLPEPFRAIPASTQMTRGELAALIGVRLEGVLRTAPPREIVVTDAAGHWAASWIALVARAGIIEPFANHTFQPESGVTRGDLAGAVRQIVARLASDRPSNRWRWAGCVVMNKVLTVTRSSVGMIPKSAPSRTSDSRSVVSAEVMIWALLSVPNERQILSSRPRLLLDDEELRASRS